MPTASTDSLPDHPASGSQSSLVPPPESTADPDPQDLLLGPSCNPPYDCNHYPELPVQLRSTWRHSHWSARRQHILDAMNSLGLSVRRRWHFANCGSSYWVQRNRHTPDEIRLVSDFCHDRFCDVCSRLRSLTISDNARKLLSKRPHKDLTLAVRSSGEPLETLLKRLINAFRRLRSTKLWTERVRGGAAFVELTYNPDGPGWHPHLHVLLDSDWMDQRELSRLWHQITGDSYVVWIQQIRDVDRAASYMAKYATKTIPASVVLRPTALREAISTLRGRRMIIQFGTWSHLKFLDRPVDHDWKTLCHYSEIDLCKHLSSSDLLILTHLIDVGVPPPDQHLAFARSPP